eukprot:6200112-Pleurochrysis_carterae.AAC.1
MRPGMMMMALTMTVVALCDGSDGNGDGCDSGVDDGDDDIAEDNKRGREEESCVPSGVARTQSAWPRAERLKQPSRSPLRSEMRKIWR